MPEFWRLIGKRPLPRIHVLSDLHFETGPYLIPPDLDCDVIVAAGDIGPIEPAVGWLASTGKPAVYVLGNHEYWGCEYADVLAAARAAARGTQVRVLENGSVVIRGVRFLGATLWTDFGSWHPGLVDEAMWRMRDYGRITARRWYDVKANLTWFRRQCLRIGMETEAVERTIAEGMFHPAIAYQLHQRSLAWLRRALQKPFAGPTVVVTHHAPTFDSLRAFGVREDTLQPENWRYRDDSWVYVAAYASRLDALLKQHADVIDAWVHGHIHRNADMLTPGVRVLCNPRGYAQRPLDARSAEALALFGVRATPEDIERSQAQFREQPYLGDAPGFDARLVIDLEDGFERPIRHEIEAPLGRLCEITEDVAELLHRLRRTRGANRRYLMRCLDHDLDAFNAIVDACLGRITPSLAGYRRNMLDQPVRPWRPFQSDLPNPHAFYSNRIKVFPAGDV